MTIGTVVNISNPESDWGILLQSLVNDPDFFHDLYDRRFRCTRLLDLSINSLKYHYMHVVISNDSYQIDM